MTHCRGEFGWQYDMERVSAWVFRKGRRVSQPRIHRRICTDRSITLENSVPSSHCQPSGVTRLSQRHARCISPRVGVYFVRRAQRYDYEHERRDIGDCPGRPDSDCGDCRTGDAGGGTRRPERQQGIIAHRDPVRCPSLPVAHPRYPRPAPRCPRTPHRPPWSAPDCRIDIPESVGKSSGGASPSRRVACGCSARGAAPPRNVADVHIEDPPAGIEGTPESGEAGPPPAAIVDGVMCRVDM